ncbi:ethanolamine-phosphate cytidylyltransferase NDAI_0K02620 [Naumovozyma dairenensis CBS 421]|uniref:ethanolamine-phosphate cytidylyltransferase n=1 Tax=Naumovozyma dairenensis (strain ATCC 10597 / BCRC 20456 / CBS 421 / NBRC 0211 / NRRL Y-12639) TaxID=1071378 RepID=G0WI42_NAUDC|nr:hypothetical protein NDAI_0K02620 [Naumovozyma dairenensis CBS 421]CCD27453.1 hypothetical protein NDAI_0K02620 [Naumovozyma dairenensis CBS 421]
MTMNYENDANRLWIDGCFDFVHHGHACAMLQARQTGLRAHKDESRLFVGVHNDTDINYNKGAPPVMNGPERYAHAKSIRWCSAVLEDAPYVTDPIWMDRFRCKYVVHGDDITLDANGVDCYHVMKKMDRFKVVKRTYGVSTTEIIQRILTGIVPGPNDEDYRPTVNELEFCSLGANGFDKHCYVFDKNLSQECQVVGGGFEMKLEDTVLVIGDFDLFHVGHIDQLRKIKLALAPDKKLIAGIKTPSVSSESGNTIMTLKERALSVLSCKYVDGIVMEPDCSITDQPDIFSKVYKMDSRELIDGGTFSVYLTKEIIIGRIEGQRDVYTKRNIQKGMTM